MSTPQNIPTRTPEEQKKFLTELMFEKHLSMTWRIVLYTVVPVFVLGFGGKLLDDLLGTGKVWMIVGMVLAFVVAQILNAVQFSRLTRHIPQK